MAGRGGRLASAPDLCSSAQRPSTSGRRPPSLPSHLPFHEFRAPDALSLGGEVRLVNARVPWRIWPLNRLRSPPSAVLPPHPSRGWVGPPRTGTAFPAGDPSWPGAVGSWVRGLQGALGLPPRDRRAPWLISKRVVVSLALRELPGEGQPSRGQEECEQPGSAGLGTEAIIPRGCCLGSQLPAVKAEGASAAEGMEGSRP